MTSPPLARALSARNYCDPTPVQTAVLAPAAVGRDLLVSAQTGSGKTVAYGIAIAANLLAETERFEAAAAPLALIVAPTRELALQVQRELAWLYELTEARVVSCVGGMDPRAEQRELAQGAHIVVGTPGRLCDHLRRHRLDISAIKAVVLDEADEMLALGFREDLEFILKTTPGDRRTLMFSATLPRGIVALARQYQNEAVRIDVSGDTGGHVDIDYRAIRVAPGDVEHAVVNLLRFFESPATLVFCNTRNAVKHLQAVLLERGFSVVALSGELTQSDRTLALQSLRDGRARVCVATDVAARGIDLPNVDLVIHADLPNDAEVMQHRSGRTGRAGRKGVSVLVVPSTRGRRAELLLDLAGIAATWAAAPSADEIRRLDHDRMLSDVLFSDAATPDDLELAKALLAARSGEEIAIALARLYRARLPSPEEISDPGERGVGARERRATARAAARERSGEPPRRDTMAEGSVWFRAAIGRRKNAEARWLLPMICRRGGIDRHDIGAIRILDATTEFEISVRAAESFAAMASRPDKDDNIRIEVMAEAPQHPQATDQAVREPRGARAPRGHVARVPRPDRKPGGDASPATPPRPFDPLHNEPRTADDVEARKFKPRRDKQKRGKPHYGKPRQAGADHSGQPKPSRDHAGVSRKKKNSKKQSKKKAPWS
jgi:ATP-dependent RNA helicase DeaD